MNNKLVFPVPFTVNVACSECGSVLPVEISKHASLSDEINIAVTPCTKCCSEEKYSEGYDKGLIDGKGGE